MISGMKLRVVSPRIYGYSSNILRRTDINGFKYGPDFFERMFQTPFHCLEFKSFSEIDLNKISKWNKIDFSKFVLT
ncbi:MAG: hypothetical protein EU535_01710 [Promethearchaeota archaeon]|nr:MAG: hypothetical protein EU535_01710 [Candidatus Lokiarchaeota archaeon]